MNMGEETHPVKLNARYKMNWANSLLKVTETLSAMSWMVD